MERYTVLDWIGRLNIIKMHFSPKRLIAISIRILARFSVAIDKIILKFICKGKGTKIIKAILKKNKVRGLSLPDFKTLYSPSNQACVLLAEE